MTGILSVEALTVSFGSVRALDGVSVELPPGVNGVLGPNGAGKTTLFRVLTLGLRPRSGSVAYDGVALSSTRVRQAYQRSVGYLPQDPGWFEGFTALELCEYMAGLRLVPRRSRLGAAKSALSAVGLEHAASTKLSALSGGQRRRAFLAQALVHDPAVLILDEPTAGLDPVQRIQLRELVQQLGSARMVLLSTHLVEDVAHSCERVFVLNEGHVVWTGSPGALQRVGEQSAVSATVSPYEQGFLAVLAGLA